MSAGRLFWVMVFVCAVALSAQQPGGLRIVVIEGEDGVNIVQTKTAVQAVVEVRDRNNLPVAGASVTFLIGGGGRAASFAGNAQQITLATNSAGRATTTSLQALSNGPVRIEVTASYQGQTASTTITQTNFATAADAAQAGKTPGSQSGSQSANTGSQASSAGTSAGSAGGAAGGSGGGLSGVVIGGIVAGGVGGAVVAKKVISSDSSSSAPSCDSQLNQFQSAVNNFLAVCTPSAAINQCIAGLEAEYNAAGAYCTCLGTNSLPPDVRQSIQTAIDQGRSIGANLSGAASCTR